MEIQGWMTAAGTALGGGQTVGAAPKTSGFEAVLNKVGEMNQNQVEANGMMSAVLNGTSENTHGALIALEEAALEMELMKKVRDELISGWKEIMRVQI